MNDFFSSFFFSDYRRRLAEKKKKKKKILPGKRWKTKTTTGMRLRFRGAPKRRKRAVVWKVFVAFEAICCRFIQSALRFSILYVVCITFTESNVRRGLILLLLLHFYNNKTHRETRAPGCQKVVMCVENH